jgi:TRAP-type C4-dicarboxylate transport system permease small subunit
MSGVGGKDRGWLDLLDRSILRATQWADEAAAVVCAFLIVATTISVVVYQRGITIVWLDDVLRMLLIWLVYLGSVSLCFHNDHITMDAVYLRLPSAVRRRLNIAVGVLGIVLCGYVTKIGLDSMAVEIDYGTLLPSGYLPAWPQTLAIPLCFALMTVAYLSYLYSVITNRRRRQDGEAPGVPEGP